MGAASSQPLPGHNPLQQNPEKIEALAKALDVKAERQKQLAIQESWDRLEQDKVRCSDCCEFVRNDLSYNFYVMV